MHERLRNFIKSASPRLPGYLAVFDFADFKRRNCHLGHLVGDKDIEEFESILNAHLSENDAWLRTGGDKWAVFTLENCLEKLNPIIRSFSRSQRVKVGWICKASLDGKTQQRETVITTTLSRAVRCAYTQVANPESLVADLGRLADYIWSCEINSPQLVGPVTRDKPNGWNCITYPTDERTCIFCGNEKFEYLGEVRQ
jgi:GGDEF domain-containing protein